MMHGYMRCAATGCMTRGTLIADVPLCEEHEGRLAIALAPHSAARADAVDLAAAWSHVVYYIIRRDSADLIKIGTSVNTSARMRSLRGGSRPLRLLVAEPGSYELEHQRHKQFFIYRATGEWFRHDPAIVEHIRSLRVQYPQWREMSRAPRSLTA